MGDPADMVSRADVLSPEEVIANALWDALDGDPDLPDEEIGGWMPYAKKAVEALANHGYKFMRLKHEPHKYGGMILCGRCGGPHDDYDCEAP